MMISVAFWLGSVQRRSTVLVVDTVACRLEGGGSVQSLMVIATCSLGGEGPLRNADCAQVSPLRR